MITPEMYENALRENARLRYELRQCQEIGNNLIVENVQLKAEIDRLKGFQETRERRENMPWKPFS